MFVLDRHYLDQMVAHAQEEDPNECCGVLLGSDSQVRQLRKCTNIEHSPFRYNVGPDEILAIERKVREQNWEVVGVYHSHPHSVPYPSPTDVRFATSSDVIHTIISLQDKEYPVVRAYRICSMHVLEVPLEVR